MKSLRDFHLTAVNLGWILIAGMVGIVVLVGVGFYFGTQYLATLATETDHTRTDATLARQEVTNLTSLKNSLEEKRIQVDKAHSIVSTSNAYAYQNQVVEDLQAYAKRVDITIQSISFPVTSPATAQAKALVNGVRSQPATLGIQDTPSYESMLKFMKLIEQNLTKMQITNISLNPDPKDPKRLLSPSLDLQVYLR